MILFVFEGKKREPMLFRSIEHLLSLGKGENICCSFGNNIYELYRQMEELGDGADIVSLLREKAKEDKNNPLEKFRTTADFSEIFLFFDLDIHNTNLEQSDKTEQIDKMLQYFDNETENGKLYINYPMVESIRYTKILPDNDYYSYVVSKCDCSCFKKLCHEFSAYKNMDHICVDLREPDKIDEKVEKNWYHLIDMNVSKANYICYGNKSLPLHKEDIAQPKIFKYQLMKYIKSDKISVLNAFPIFLFDYRK